jgi:hypothetical protein
MRYCPACGTPVEATSRWCGVCGHQLTPSSPPGTGAVPSPAPAGAGRPRPSLPPSMKSHAERALVSARRRPKVAIAGAACVVVLLVVLAVVVIGGGNSNGLASAYTCDFSASQSATINFTNTGNSQGDGLAGSVTSNGRLLETFEDGSIEDGQISFGPFSTRHGSHPSYIPQGALEHGDIVLPGHPVVCSPS